MYSLTSSITSYIVEAEVRRFINTMNTMQRRISNASEQCSLMRTKSIFFNESTNIHKSKTSVDGKLEKTGLLLCKNSAKSRKETSIFVPIAPRNACQLKLN